MMRLVLTHHFFYPFGKCFILDKNIGYDLYYKISKENINTTDNYKVKHMTLYEREFTANRERIYMLLIPSCKISLDDYIIIWPR